MNSIDRDLFIESYGDMIKWRIDIYNLLDEYTFTLLNLRRLIDGRKGSGGKLIKIGSILIFTPIPVVSEVLGAILILIGLILSKFARVYSLRDIIRLYNYIFLDITKLKREFLVESSLNI